LIKHASEIMPEVVREGIHIHWLLTNQDGAPNFAMRIIELAPGVVFQPHDHPYEHEIYVLEGEGFVTNPEGDFGKMEPGKFVLIQPDEAHGYRNTGNVTLRFICVIPNQD
jgi:quercetin dioxygenase-like cupin family protein